MHIIIMLCIYLTPCYIIITTDWMFPYFGGGYLGRMLRHSVMRELTSSPVVVASVVLTPSLLKFTLSIKIRVSASSSPRFIFSRKMQFYRLWDNKTTPIVLASDRLKVDFSNLSLGLILFQIPKCSVCLRLILFLFYPLLCVDMPNSIIVFVYSLHNGM